MNDNSLAQLIESLAALPEETEWVEFKVNYSEHNVIGEEIAALSNSAALNGKKHAYIVWGIEDKTHDIVGTTFKPKKAKEGNEELENWLTTQLEPQIHFSIYEMLAGDHKRCVIFEIEAARHAPISFKGKRFIRVGSYKKPLSKHPEKERILWRLFEQTSLELSSASPALDIDEILRLLSWQDYYRLMGLEAPIDPNSVIDRFSKERFVERTGRRHHITVLGALLFATDMADFDVIRRKPVRVVFYPGKDRTQTLYEAPGRKGYASGFSALVQYIERRLPTSEEIREALRVDVPIYPTEAIRELVANALIHQDLAATGTGPMVEIFKDRIEITNPGTPIIDIRRFIDQRQSRNERLAQSMRMLKVCEERGSGIDKVLRAIEAYQLPAPDFRQVGEHTMVVLFTPRTFADMTKEERIRACYQHAGLKSVAGEWMTNETLRARFGLPAKNASQASRVIGDTLAVKLIKPYDPKSKSKKLARYLPYWA